MTTSSRLPLFGGAAVGRPTQEFGLHLFEPRYVDMAKDAMVKSNGRFGFITSRAPDAGADGIGGAGSTGWRARITHAKLNDDGTIDVRCAREGRGG